MIGQVQAALESKQRNTIPWKMESRIRLHSLSRGALPHLQAGSGTGLLLLLKNRFCWRKQKKRWIFLHLECQIIRPWENRKDSWFIKMIHWKASWEKARPPPVRQGNDYSDVGQEKSAGEFIDKQTLLSPRERFPGIESIGQNPKWMCWIQDQFLAA